MSKREIRIESFATFVAALALAGSLLPQPVQKALSLLPSDIAGHAQTRVTVVQPKSKYAPETSLAWVKQGDPKIYVADWSANYKKAASGDRVAIIKLAAQLAHETWHQKHGPDEASAYDEQLRVLKLLGAPNDVIKKIEKIKKEVLKDPNLYKVTGRPDIMTKG